MTGRTRKKPTSGAPGKATVGPRTCELAYIVLGAAFRIIRPDLLDNVSKPVAKPKEMHPWSIEERDRFLDHLDATRDEHAAFLKLLLATGLRKGEALALRGNARIWQYEPRTLSKRAKTLMVQAKVPVIRMHALRHSFATVALIRGLDVTIVAQYLGHSSTKITSDTYQHIVPGMMESAAELINARGEASTQRIDHSGESPANLTINEGFKTSECWTRTSDPLINRQRTPSSRVIAKCENPVFSGLFRFSGITDIRQLAA
ncbi:MAG TPA: tyrosine-type recombinase/integrase [Candidatus Baltobacteraceae bacterium]